jgi:hypothetical protein
MVVPRGEAVRNFLYSDTLRILSERGRVSLLSIITDEEILGRVRPFVEQIIPLKNYPEHFLVEHLRYLVHTAHFRWLWSEAAKYHWGLHQARAKTLPLRLKRLTLKGLSYPLGNRPMLELSTKLERYLSWVLRPTDDFTTLFRELQPDLIFNCSHIHGPLADLPLRVAHKLGIPTAVFIFSWDNLTSRSRIFVPYDYYLMWNQQMREQLLNLYARIQPDQVIVTGTPQLDFHFRPEYWLGWQELCKRIGADPGRPLVLYSTGMHSDFPDEHRIVEGAIRFLQEIHLNPKPQLVVRTYIKGTSPEMQRLARQNIPGVVFPPMLWDRKTLTPLYEDLHVYTSLLRHVSVGINAASTVTLELMLHDKPVINLGFEPPGSHLPHHARFSRHIEYEHYRPVAESGGVMVARSMNDLREMLLIGLTEPQTGSEKRRLFIQDMFDHQLDGQSGRRVAETLVALARKHS